MSPPTYTHYNNDIHISVTYGYNTVLDKAIRRVMNAACAYRVDATCRLVLGYYLLNVIIIAAPTDKSRSCHNIACRYRFFFPTDPNKKKKTRSECDFGGKIDRPF